MAFSTEFVMGAGGGVEEIPVSMSGGGGTSSSPVAHPLATVDAGDGAVILVIGMLVPASTSTSSRPHLQIGSYTHSEPNAYLTGPTGVGIGGLFTGVVQISIISRFTVGTSTFDGTVYVTRV